MGGAFGKRIVRRLASHCITLHRIALPYTSDACLIQFGINHDRIPLVECRFELLAEAAFSEAYPKYSPYPLFAEVIISFLAGPEIAFRQ